MLAKNTEELTTTYSDVSSLEPKIMEAVAEAAREARFGRQFLTVNERLIGERGRTLTFPFRSKVEGISVVTEGTIPSVKVEATYSTVTVNVTKYGTYVRITQEAIDSVRVDIIEDQIKEVGEALADYEDWKIMNELYGASAYVTETIGVGAANTVFSLGTSPVLEINLCSGTTITARDYYDGKVEVVAAMTTCAFSYKYSTRNRTVDCSGISAAGASHTGSDVYIGLLDGYANLVEVPRKPTAAILHMKHWSGIAKDDRFIDRSRSGQPLLITGALGRAAALEITRCDHAYPGAMMILEPRRDKYFVVKRNLDMRKKDRPEWDSFEFYFYQEYMPAVIRDDGICLVFNAGEGSKNL